SSNTTGNWNTASGYSTLADNTIGSLNTASGAGALELNTTGVYNTASGGNALLYNTTGSYNIAVGANAGSKQTPGRNNIYAGHPGVAAESTTMRLGQGQTRTFIAGIKGVPVSGSQVLINSSGQVGILASSARYKRDIQDMKERSQGLLQLRPVTFRYKQDPQG